MSLDDPTDEERLYAANIFNYGCSRFVSTILLTIVLALVLSSYVPSPTNVWIFFILGLWSLTAISGWLTGWFLGPPPKMPDSLRE